MVSPVAETRTARYELLDAMRGIAILAVLFLHFSERGVESSDQLVHSRIWPVLQHGYLGVQLFFVISGYCIMAAVSTASAKDSGVSYFTTRRLRRIFPPYWASLVLVIAAGLVTGLLLKTPWSTVFPLKPWEWLANVFLMQGPLQATDANLVYWSLSIELQFYLVMAACLLMSPKISEIWLVFVGFVSVVLALTHVVPLTGWVLNYWAEFACGIAAYFWITRRRQWSWTPWLLVAGAAVEMLGSIAEHHVWVLSNGRFIPGIRIAVCLGIMAAMIQLYRFDAMLCQKKFVRNLMAVGTISYSLYLTHVPVGTRVFNLGQRLTGLSGCWWLLYFAISLLASAIVGVLFFRWCERPWMNSPISQKSRPHKSLIPVE
jgi:peptidoglycan/LPS O-acetylase OafA/YrhL